MYVYLLLILFECFFVILILLLIIMSHIFLYLLSFLIHFKNHHLQVLNQVCHRTHLQHHHTTGKLVAKEENTLLGTVVTNYLVVGNIQPSLPLDVRMIMVLIAIQIQEISKLFILVTKWISYS